MKNSNGQKYENMCAIINANEQRRFRYVIYDFKENRNMILFYIKSRSIYWFEKNFPPNEMDNFS